MNAPRTDGASEAVAQLEALSAELAGRGFKTRVTADGHSLNVANRVVPEVREVISVAPTDDGAWWFRWSWGDRIAPVTDIEAAAFKIAYVLNPVQM